MAINRMANIATAMGRLILLLRWQVIRSFILDQIDFTKWDLESLL
jgi:hypothetical protein